MTIQTSEGDYVIFKEKTPTSKPWMLKISDQDDDEVTGVIEDKPHIDPRTVTVSRKDILVNLGKTPPKGKVYGIEVGTRYILTKEHDWWGPIHFFTKPSKADYHLLWKSLDRTARKLDKHPSAKYKDSAITEIILKLGKYAGMYRHSNKDGIPNRIQYAVEAAQGSAEMMDYVIYHEFGHSVMYNGIKGKKALAAWVRMFNYSIAKVVVDLSDLKRLRKEIEKSESSEGKLVSSFKEIADADEDDKARLKVLLRWMHQIHHLSMKDLEILWAAGDFQSLYDLWPTASIDSSKLNPLVSDYACKAMPELFAESFAFTLTGKKLPKKVASLVEITLSQRLQ